MTARREACFVLTTAASSDNCESRARSGAGLDLRGSGLRPGYFLLQLNIQLMPYASVTMPKVAPQNVS